MTKKKFSEADIAAYLERHIVDNAIAPGVRLASAGELARQYDVSPKTADRALNRLVRKGLISRERGRGNFVLDNRDPAKRFRVGLLWWRLDENIPEFNFNPADTFFHTLCRLLDEHRISYDVYCESCRQLEQPANREKKYDMFLLPAGVILNDKQIFRSGRMPMVIYGDHKFNPGPWNQIIYDYRPGFTALLEYCRSRHWHKFFLPYRNLSILDDKYEILQKCAENLGFKRSDFHLCPAAADAASTAEAGELCARYFLEHHLQDHIIICGSDFLTFGMQKFFHSQNMSCGRDYELLSYDNFQKYLKFDNDYFQVSSITHPQEQHAAAVVDMIEELTRRPETGYFRTYITPANEFIVREARSGGHKHKFSGE